MKELKQFQTRIFNFNQVLPVLGGK
jgi:hypothetical protein